MKNTNTKLTSLCFTKKATTVVSPPPTTIGITEGSSIYYLKLRIAFFTLLLLVTFLKGFASSPPTGTSRGMYVSCGEVLIQEIKDNSDLIDMDPNNSACLTPKTRDLFNYAIANNFTYLAIYGLAKKYTTSGSPIIGNTTFTNALRALLYFAHTQSPRINIGMVVSNKEFFEDPLITGTSSGGAYNFITPDFYDPFPGSYSCDYRMTTDTGNVYVGDSTLYNTNDTSFLAKQRAEMMKGFLRLGKYSVESDTWVNANLMHDGATYNYLGKGSNDALSESGGDEPLLFGGTPQDFLFDYMSLEFEYWNNSVNNRAFDKYVLAATASVTAERLFWNDFVDITYAAAAVSRWMCWRTKTELELVLKPMAYSSADPNKYALKTDEQAEFIASYFQRALISNYTQSTTNPIHATRAEIIRFSKINPLNIFSGFDPYNSVSSTPGRMEVWPVFSAATSGEVKHCFGTIIPDPNSPSNPATWPDLYYGQYLSTSGNTMAGIETLYKNKFDNPSTVTASSTDCDTYIGEGVSPCTFTTNYTSTTSPHSVLLNGFMWYNYSMLNFHVGASNHVYTKQMLSNVPSESNQTIVWNQGNKELKIIQTSDVGLAWNTLQIFDIAGKLLLSEVINSSEQTLNLHELKAGIYIARVSGSNKNSKTYKLVLAN